MFINKLPDAFIQSLKIEEIYYQITNWDDFFDELKAQAKQNNKYPLQILVSPYHLPPFIVLDTDTIASAHVFFFQMPQFPISNQTKPQPNKPSRKTIYRTGEKFVCPGCSHEIVVDEANPKATAFIWGQKNKKRPYCFDCDGLMIQGQPLPNDPK